MNRKGRKPFLVSAKLVLEVIFELLTSYQPTTGLRKKERKKMEREEQTSLVDTGCRVYGSG
jgi:hypothetical protein